MNCYYELYNESWFQYSTSSNSVIQTFDVKDEQLIWRQMLVCTLLIRSFEEEINSVGSRMRSLNKNFLIENKLTHLNEGNVNVTLMLIIQFQNHLFNLFIYQDAYTQGKATVNVTGKMNVKEKNEQCGDKNQSKQWKPQYSTNVFREKNPLENKRKYFFLYFLIHFFECVRSKILNAH